MDKKTTHALARIFFFEKKLGVFYEKEKKSRAGMFLVVE